MAEGRLPMAQEYQNALSYLESKYPAGDAGIIRMADLSAARRVELAQATAAEPKAKARR